MVANGDGGTVIAAIYDAILEPSGWECAIKRIVAASNSISGALIVHKTGAVHFTALCNVDPFYADAYAQTYSKISPLAAEAATIAPGEVRAATHITQTDSFRASVFYNEFACPQGWADVVRIGLLRAPGGAGRLVLHRSPNAIWVEPPEWQLLQAIAPHLKRAAAVHELLSRAREAANSIGAADEAVGFAVFLLAKDCRVLFANAKAEDLVRCGSGLRYERGRLATATPSLAERLHSLVRQATRPAGAGAGAGGTLELGLGEGRPTLIAYVIPLTPKRAADVFDIERPAAAVFVVDPTVELCARIRNFAARFGLTAGETRVLKEIIGGSGLSIAAARLRISLATIRTHTYRIFEKTGTGRQAELIRRFFGTGLRGPGVPFELH
jgi:DNA-binding CsgD family transcriptional regulator